LLHDRRRRLAGAGLDDRGRRVGDRGFAIAGLNRRIVTAGPEAGVAARGVVTVEAAGAVERTIAAVTATPVMAVAAVTAHAPGRSRGGREGREGERGKSRQSQDGGAGLHGYLLWQRLIGSR